MVCWQEVKPNNQNNKSTLLARNSPAAKKSESQNDDGQKRFAFRSAIATRRDVRKIKKSVCEAL